jgi:ABC-2 type transport system permease protein
MRQVAAVVLRELIIFRRRFWRYFFSFSIAPFLYLVAFGWAGKARLGEEGTSYSLFLIPGLVAMSSMINSFSLAMEINVARFYWRTFDEIRSAPVTDVAYVTGEVLSGMFRGLFAAGIVITLGLVFSVPLSMSPWLPVSVVLNTFVFSALAVSAAMLAKKHADQSLINSFVITPMAFLCGTFFPVSYYPSWIQKLIGLLPLTHASAAIRAAALDDPLPVFSVVYLALFGGVAFYLAVRVVRLSQN